MDKKNIIPQQAQPVVRVSQGTQADLLAELSEETLSNGASASMVTDKVSMACYCACSYDGDDAE